MNVALLYPAALAALAALVIPIVLHLIRRAEYTLTPFAAMRWIAAQLRQQRRLRLRDVPLLLLRLLLLALLATLLAQPVLRGEAGAPDHVVLVAPGADVAAARQRVDAPNADWRWLAVGFPALATTSAPSTSASASLLREIDADLPASSRISVVVPAVVDGLDGDRPRLSRAVEWIVVDGAMPSVPAIAMNTPDALRVRGADAATAPVIAALQTAWKRHDWPGIKTDSDSDDTAIPADTRWLLWLSPQRPQTLLDWIAAGGIAVAVSTPAAMDATTDIPIWRDATQMVIATRRGMGRGRLIQLRGALSAAQLPALLDGDFPARLHALFAGDAAASTRASADALRPRSTEATTTSAIAMQATRMPLDPWFATLIAALFAVERIWASARRKVSP